jgi:hypothetical protein
MPLPHLRQSRRQTHAPSRLAERLPTERIAPRARSRLGHGAQSLTTDTLAPSDLGLAQPDR